MRRLCLTLLTATLSLTAHAGHAGEVLGIPTYQAHYSLEVGGGPVATADFYLERQADRATYRYESRAVGLFAMFYKDNVTEESILQIQDGVARPLEYSYIHEGSKKPRNVITHFDWSANKASGESRGEPFSIKIPNDVMDRFSVQLLLMQHLSRGKPINNFPILDKNELGAFAFEILGEETLETELGTFKTVKVTRSNGNRNRTTIGWYAPEMHYLPVQIEQSKKGSSRKVVMKIQKIDWR